MSDLKTNFVNWCNKVLLDEMKIKTGKIPHSRNGRRPRNGTVLSLFGHVNVNFNLIRTVSAWRLVDQTCRLLSAGSTDSSPHSGLVFPTCKKHMNFSFLPFRTIQLFLWIVQRYGPVIMLRRITNLHVAFPVFFSKSEPYGKRNMEFQCGAFARQHFDPYDNQANILSWNFHNHR